MRKARTVRLVIKNLKMNISFNALLKNRIDKARTRKKIWYD